MSDNYQEIVKEARVHYKLTGNIPNHFYERAIDNPPNVPDSPEIDTNFSYYNDMIAYIRARDSFRKEVFREN